MNESILQEAGLTKAEARLYACLVKNSPASPPKLANLVNESRTNAYKILDSLEELGLVQKDETEKKIKYWASNPSSLLNLLKENRAKLESKEKRFQAALPSLIDEYFQYSEQPAIRYFHGSAGIGQIYKDQLADSHPITFIHSIGVRDYFGVNKMHNIRNDFPKHKIKRHVFYPDIAQHLESSDKRMPVAESDKIMLLTRTWLSEHDLKSPVEWAVYGDKLSIISLGTEVVGMIIESPQIASSFLEILNMLRKGIEARPEYKKHPQKLLFTKTPEIS